MRLVSVLGVLVACGGPAPEVAKPAPEPTEAPLQLPRHVDRVGDVRLEHKIDTAEEKRGETTLEQYQERRRRITVLAMHEGEPSKIRVAYEESKFSLIVDGVDSGQQYPSLAGNTYLLERVADRVDTVKEHGTITNEERDAVIRDNRQFTQPTRLLDVLASRVWKRGEAVDVESSSISGDKNVTGTTSFRLLGYDNEVARFEGHAITKVGELTVDLTMRFEVDVRDPVYMSMSATGTITQPGMTATSETRIVTKRR